MLIPKALVSGASLAGPVVAFWLLRAGFEVTVVEQAPGPRRGGNGVDIRAEALSVIGRMGLSAAVRTKSVVTKGMRFVDRDDRQRGRIDKAGMERMVGSEDVEITRGDLASILYEATRNDVEYVFGDTIKALAQDHSEVDVMFAHGPPRRFDLLVGADGFHSNVRRLVFGPEERFSVFKNHYFATAGADFFIGEPYWTTNYSEPGKSVSVFRDENGRGQVNFIFRSQQPLVYEFRDTAGQKRLLRKAFAGLGWHVPALLDAAEAAPDFYFDAIGQMQMPSWSNGRIALVGDAAYCASPASGAGALLALTGAYRLAGELAAGGDFEAAFARYEAAQRPLVARKQANLFTGISVPRTRLAIAARNLFVSSPLVRLVSGPQSDKGARLKEYAFPGDRLTSAE
ncbi:FAD-dependent monooxygenase [Acidisoma silvae]|uniref:FAD-dependent monooxygenase n=1 Tax=Acidisoma silvae TaxID=2802396 RepID=A0A963YUP8_9PROT|nr:FAD-dependent monooxygenase [Acidisoma silvae]MCB8877405.1 FAD-dependent monooxygenase [Acidisoma silvae]